MFLAAISTLLYNLGWLPPSRDDSQDEEPIQPPTKTSLCRREVPEIKNPEPELFQPAEHSSFSGKEGQIVAATVRERTSHQLLPVAIYSSGDLETDPLNNYLPAETHPASGLFRLPRGGEYLLRFTKPPDQQREIEIQTYRAAGNVNRLVLKDTLVKGILEQAGEIDLFRIPVELDDRLLIETTTSSDSETVGTILFDDSGILASSSLSTTSRLEAIAFSQGDLTLAIYGLPHHEEVAYKTCIRDLGRPVTLSKNKSIVSIIDFPGDSKMFYFTAKAKEKWQLELRCREGLWADLIVVDPRGSVFPKASCNQGNIVEFPATQGAAIQGTYRIKVIGVQGTKGPFDLAVW